MLLHTVNKSPFQTNSLESCLGHIKDGSGVLLIEDGVYGALEGGTISPKVKEAMKTKKVYALGPDLKIRGVADSVMDGVQVVDYTGFVDLTAEFSQVQAWL
ncbi:MAG: sulfurtransferase complex subunit TusB [Proteobacteria bacterium]|nr:sulfurtransferase complex subunit TusB [Pseudomonadota bacterium]